MQVAPLLNFAVLVFGATADKGTHASHFQLDAGDARQLPLPGGAGAAQPASSDPMVQKLCDEVKDDAIAYLQHTTGAFEDGFDYFDAVSFCTQVVAGTIYYILLTAGRDGLKPVYAVELKIFKPLPYMNAPPQLKAATANCTSASDWASVLHEPSECSKK
mmetsp:Transcript_40347/g.112042  ORF Transcript_40347/g.112042 Transcript_40347/m.112042 type:complete len:160 (-) Transcript_40347:283-762(-)